MYGIDRKWHHHRRRRGNEAFVTREEALVPSMIDTPDLSVMAKLLSKRFGCRGFSRIPWRDRSYVES